MRSFLLFLSLAFMAACSSGSKEVDLQIPNNLTPDAKTLLSSSWPKIKGNCPGLTKYGQIITVDGIEDGLTNPDKENRKLTIKLKVTDDYSSVPKGYYANGQYCYLDLSADGSTLTVSKDPCKAICLDQIIKGTALEKQDPLVIPLK